jgi:hypothetical protein
MYTGETKKGTFLDGHTGDVGIMMHVNGRIPVYFRGNREPETMRSKSHISLVEESVNEDT